MPTVSGQSAIPKVDTPVNYGVVLYPYFQALDVFGSLDPLNSLAFEYHLNLYIIAATLDPVSTRPPDDENPKKSDFAQSIVPTHTFETAPPLDVLIVPGGRADQAVVDFIAKLYPSLKYLFTVCTGSGIAARAGVLDGKQATTNKMEWEKTIALRPQVTWITHARWVVDGNIWTSSGVSAGMDAMLAFIAEIYGKGHAEKISNYLEYKRHEDSKWDPFSDLYGLK
ncbi:DJ-1/PfpI family protein [Crucibulum laeve]|uniref:DJ-1/PfpI family protein n=1 Tax=Crucibulum laeve TaxID=68775 RepID=A0A5C3LMJ9_9AGAR|nr:DJ-1/PfpI family protein [Crucibulum laeve]